MASNLKVFKKSSPNGKLTVYLGKRDIVDYISSTEPIDGVVVVDDSYLQNTKVFGQVICSFRYGREEDEIMGLNFQKDLYLASEEILSFSHKNSGITWFQERLIKKLGPNAFPFSLKIHPNSPVSVTLQPGPEDQGQPCGLHYYLKIFTGENESDRSHKRSTITLGIRKVQCATLKEGKQPYTIVRKDFMLSPGELEIELTSDKKVRRSARKKVSVWMYYLGDKVVVNVCIQNNSNKIIKKIKATIQQETNIVLFQNGQQRFTIASTETQEGCPIQPGSGLQKCFYLVPTIEGNRHRRGIALEGQLKNQDSQLASSTILASHHNKDVFGIIVSYFVKVKLYLGALGGEVVAELPILLMKQKTKENLIEYPSDEVKESIKVKQF